LFDGYLVADVWMISDGELIPFESGFVPFRDDTATIGLEGDGNIRMFVADFIDATKSTRFENIL